MNYILQNPISEELKAYAQQIRIKLAYRLSVLFLIVFSLLTFAYYSDSMESFITMAAGVVISLVCLSVMMLWKNDAFVFYTYSILGVLVTSYALIAFHETIHLVDILWMHAAVALAFFTIGKKLGYVLLAISLIAIGIFLFYSLNKNIVTVQPRTTYQLVSLMAEMISGFGLNMYLFYLFLGINHFSEQKLLEINQHLQEQNTQIQIQNDEKTVLVREIHHRVKNNLQIIISLLRMQSMEIEEEKLKIHFEESINRIMTMSLIHTKLYQNDSLSQINFPDYLKDLMQDLLRINPGKKTISYDVVCPVENISLKTIIPLGLIFNELISNSLKHAFSFVENGKIDIDIQEEENEWLIIRYMDNGKWKKRENYASFGMTLIDTLVDQLDGKIERIFEEHATIYNIRVKNQEDARLPIS